MKVIEQLAKAAIMLFCTKVWVLPPDLQKKALQQVRAKTNPTWLMALVVTGAQAQRKALLGVKRKQSVRVTGFTASEKQFIFELLQIVAASTFRLVPMQLEAKRRVSKKVVSSEWLATVPEVLLQKTTAILRSQGTCSVSRAVAWVSKELWKQFPCAQEMAIQTFIQMVTARNIQVPMIPKGEPVGLRKTPLLESRSMLARGLTSIISSALQIIKEYFSKNYQENERQMVGQRQDEPLFWFQPWPIESSAIFFIILVDCRFGEQFILLSS